MIAKRFAIALLMTLALCACQDKDAKIVLKTLNEDPRLVNRSVHVKKVAFEKGHDDSVRPYNADVLDKQGKVVGKARGRRVDGFGTVRPRIEWSDPALADKSLDPAEDNNSPLKNKVMQSDANGDGKVTYEEALAANPHLMKPAFDYLDKNGDGVISAEDDTYTGPRKNRRFGGGGGRGGGGGGGGGRNRAP
jgi:hypothetical protein